MSATEPQQVGIRELRQHASRYIEMAERGITVDIARRGHIVAQLVPYRHGKQDPLQELYDAGLLRPAEHPGSVLDIVPVKPSSDVSLSDVIVQMREEERF